MGTKPPYWIDQLAIKGYRLYHPRNPDKKLSIDEILYCVAEYARHLEHRLGIWGTHFSIDICPDCGELWPITQTILQDGELGCICHLNK